MKSPLLLLPLLLILSFTFTSKPFFVSSQTDAVVDTDGDSLRTGGTYYILPVFRGRGGGVESGAARRGLCPLAVVQAPSELSRGVPVKFSRVDGKNGTVPMSKNLNIMFLGPNICRQSNVWNVGPYDEEVNQYFVITGGVLGIPGPETAGNWFKIEKVNRAYKIVFCPSVRRISKAPCKDVGIYMDGVVWRLALSDMPLGVKFKKV